MCCQDYGPNDVATLGVPDHGHFEDVGHRPVLGLGSSLPPPHGSRHELDGRDFGLAPDAGHWRAAEGSMVLQKYCPEERLSSMDGGPSNR
jgi:hypothetical protein